MSSLLYDGRVAIVTGAGGGLGRTYALALAKRGAKVVVNDLGGSAHGKGSGHRAADLVVEEIKKDGGVAVANYDSVEHGERIVKTAMDAFGRIDILINNAGILRDVSFQKMADSDWDLIYKVHLFGAKSVTKAAWDIMREQKYGRIIMTSSAAGLYGNFGQSNYSAMKLSLLGFANSLSKEGAKRNIHVNTIAPVAGSRLTATVMPPEMVDALKPDYVAPLVLYLCHESTDTNGEVFELGAGWVSRLRWQRTEGHLFPLNPATFTPEAIRDNWKSISDFDGPTTYPTAMNDSMGYIMENLERAKNAATPQAAVTPSKTRGNEHIQPDKVIGYEFPSSDVTYSERDSILYALGVGAGQNPSDESELPFVYENSGDFSALPTMGVTFPFSTLSGLASVEGLNFNPMMLLHGEQYLEIRKPIPVSATLTNHGKIKNVYDKGSGALLIVAAETRDQTGDVVCYNESSVFIRGIGGFGGDRGPKPPAWDVGGRAPDAVVSFKTLESQALLYRLSGDYNPLHVDPQMAAMGNFERPILHGLCFFGIAGRAVLKEFCGNDATKFGSVKARFSKHVFPGETVVTEMWKTSEDTVLFRCKVQERGDVVLSNGVATLKVSASSTPASSSTGSTFAVAPTFVGIEAQVASRGDALVKQVGAVFRFDITKGSEVKSWLVDLKSGKGSVSVDSSSSKPADLVIAMSDDNAVALFSGKLNPQQAFMGGKLKLKGNMALASKLQALTSPAAKL